MNPRLSEYRDEIEENEEFDRLYVEAEKDALTEELEYLLTQMDEDSEKGW